MNHSLDTDELDVFTEILNVGAGRSADVLHKLLGKRLHVSIPHVSMGEEYLSMFASPGLFVELRFSGPFSGWAGMAISSKSAGKLSSILLGVPVGSDTSEIDWLDPVTEVGNIVVNSVVGAIAEGLKMRFEYTPPRVLMSAEIVSLAKVARESVALVASTSFEVEAESIRGNIVLLIENQSFEILKARLGRLYEEAG